MTDTHNVDGAEGNAERGIHTLPHTRWAAGPIDYIEGGGAADRLGGARRSIWPEEKLCDLCLTEFGSYRYTLGGKVLCGKKVLLNLYNFTEQTWRCLSTFCHRNYLGEQNSWKIGPSGSFS